MTKFTELKAQKVVKALSKLGFTKSRSVGSHLRLVHPDGRKVTIAIHNKPIPKGTLKSILRQAEISYEELTKKILSS